MSAFKIECDTCGDVVVPSESFMVTTGDDPVMTRYSWVCTVCDEVRSGSPSSAQLALLMRGGATFVRDFYPEAGHTNDPSPICDFDVYLLTQFMDSTDLLAAAVLESDHGSHRTTGQADSPEDSGG